MNKLIATVCCLLLYSLLQTEAGASPLLFAGGSQADGGPSGRLFSVSLFTDTISGTVFNDIGGNAARDLSDPGLQNWRIRLFEASLEVDSTLTDAGGGFRFTNIAPGSYTVSQAVQPGWSQTLPVSGGSYALTLLAGQHLAVRPAFLPGEGMRVFILREGKEVNQGIAYLEDGTMVVVDGARRPINTKGEN